MTPAAPTVPATTAAAERPTRRRRHGRLLARLAHLVGVLVLVTLAATALVDLLPGSPAATILGPTATAEAIAELEAETGYDRPLPERYATWLGNALTGDLGSSVQSNRPVLEQILDRVPVTLELTVLALVMALAAAVPAALLAAHREGGPADRAATGLASGLLSVPVFVAGVLLIYAFAVVTGWFPVSGWSPLSDGLVDNLAFAFLPALALAIGEAPGFYRLLRGDLVHTLHQDFVRTAEVRGLPRRYVLLRHALRPSSFSLLTVAAMTFGRLLAGSVVVESLFALPGLGALALQAIPARDLPLIQGIVALVAVVYVVVNMVVDAAYAVLDPRVRAA
ncbi:ABC transporter permease [Pseudonocardia lacus]|uniref:ABC transporter permease n=1 Tax=Pseudonocardia lacus TaxID=2835865 RepID=UPI001BDC4265|nr:ABC transporter permease [Pseudonocardia lacus]